ncbi:MAG: hypothetical protein AAF938_10945 [Myxococcota bacterium]
MKWCVYAGLLFVAACSVARADDVEAPTCVEVDKSAPIRGYGHAHIVHVENGCDRPVRCAVATDVDPTPTQITVPAGEREDVVARIGSPASTFEAIVDCELRSP